MCEMTMEQMKDEYDRQRHILIQRIKDVQKSDTGDGEKRLRVKSLHEYLNNLTYASKEIYRYFANRAHEAPLLVVLSKSGEEVLSYE